ncbi:MAG: alpha/beta hydrolase [Hyphomicrobiaceae bacterium]|nr:alpha/beta hydrolase [Hyphomicrobiaceae bacterium]
MNAQSKSISTTSVGGSINASTQSLPKLVMVHGTGAGDIVTTGKSWWQLGSPFQKELARRLDLDPSRVEIVPFQWELGPNSENGRRLAAEALYTKLKEFDQAGQDYYLVGHSHGGSVIHHALLYATARGKPFERLKSWCTVGTPFLEYRANRFLHSRLGNTGLTVYASAVGALIIAAGLAAMYLFGATPFWKSVNDTLGKHALIGFYIPVIAALTTYGVVSLSVLYNIARYRGGSYPQAVKQKVANLYADRWLGLWHQDDEAISALSNVKNVSGPIIPSSFLVPFISILPLLLTIIGCLYASAYFLFDGSKASPATLNFFKSVGDTLEKSATTSKNTTALGSAFSAIYAIGVPALLAALVMAIYVGVTGLFVGLLKVVTGWIGIPLSKMIDGLVWSSVKQSAWGDDRGHESVHQIGAHPPEFSEKYNPLPPPIAAKLSENSEKQAVLTLHKVREVLGMIPKSKSSPDMRAELSDKLSWQELIHTTYFDIPEFVDLMSLSLHRAGLTQLDASYWQGDKRDQTERNYHLVHLSSALPNGKPASNPA